jgi:tRNA pseudouridine38-40 synthase
VRIAVGVEYAGGRFAGWQRQDGLPTIQGELERTLAAVAAHPVAVTGAGRTDAGVHALEQVAHFDSDSQRPLRGWVLGANVELPNDIAIRWAAQVPEDFHARRSALARTYCYLVLNRRTRPALARERAAFVHEQVSVEAMAEAARALLGRHDFSAFRAAECQSLTPVRELRELTIRAAGELIEFWVTADAFLHHMVRNLVGTLLEVGTGARPVAWVGEALASRDRRVAGPTAPAHGLYLARVRYPQTYGLPFTEGTAVSAMIPRDLPLSTAARAAERWPEPPAEDAP